jgi:hypothetical protein
MGLEKQGKPRKQGKWRGEEWRGYLRGGVRWPGGGRWVRWRGEDGKSKTGVRCSRVFDWGAGLGLACADCSEEGERGLDRGLPCLYTGQYTDKGGEGHER